MEFGIFSLFAVQFLLSFLAFTAWRAIASEAGRVKDAENRTASRMDALEQAVTAATAKASAAEAEAKAVRGAHFDTLLRRIDSAEASTLAQTKQVETLLDKVASLGGRLSNFQRTYKRSEETEPAPAPGTNGIEQTELPVMSPQVVPGHFGRKAK